MISEKSVSLCMVVWNSSDLVERAIESVKDIVDEIVIVDQGSDPEHSKKLKALANVYDKTTNKGNADYDRQYCYALATKDLILAMDADEIVPPETKVALATHIKDWEFDVCWFLFQNIVTINQREMDLQDMLGVDPHPRLWKRVIDGPNGQKISPVIWPTEAHQMPQIPTPFQFFSGSKFLHKRRLEDLITTHLHRRHNISEQAVGVERNFLRGVMNKLDFAEKKQLNEQFPELPNYLKD